MSDNELVDALDNTIAPPTLTYPKAAYYQYGFKVYPEEINRVICTYVRIPQTPVWGYTLVNDEPIYNPSTSVNFEFPESTLMDIANLCLLKLGISIRDADIVNTSATRQKEGV